MNENDPRAGLDPITAAILDKMRIELEIAVKKLMCSDSQMALAQVDCLHERAIHRLKKWDFEMDLMTSGLPQKDVVKVTAVTIAALEETFDIVRQHIVDCAKSIYGDDADDAATE